MKNLLITLTAIGLVASVGACSNDEQGGGSLPTQQGILRNQLGEPIAGATVWIDNHPDGGSNDEDQDLALADAQPSPTPNQPGSGCPRPPANRSAFAVCTDEDGRFTITCAVDSVDIKVIKDDEEDLGSTEIDCFKNEPQTVVVTDPSVEPTPTPTPTPTPPAQQ